MKKFANETVEILVPADYYEGFFEHTKDYDLPTHLPYPCWKYPDDWVKSKVQPRNTPLWWMKQSAINYKSCPSYINIMKKTIVIPMPTEFGVKTNEEGLEYKFASDLVIMDSNHPNDQFAGLIPDNIVNMKYIMPFSLKLSRKQSLLMTDCHLHSSNYAIKPWRTMTGVLSVEKHVPINVNTVWDLAHLGSIDKHNIELGTPMMYITLPEAKGKVEVKFVKVSNQHKNLFGMKTLHVETRSYKL